MRLTSFSSRSALTVLALGLAACGGGGGNDTDAGTTPVDASLVDSGPVPHDAGGPACAPVDPACQDQQISMLDLFTTVSTRTVEEVGTDPAVHISHIDSMAGGISPTESYVYARFTDTGLERVAISDQDAFASQDWDIAFRRFIIRINSGVSGPSCVQAARTAPATTFDSVTSVPAGLDFHSEIYMTDGTCDIVADGSGLGSPATVLSSFWTYPGCVSMTHNVYVLQLANGRHVKLEVLDYYLPADQMACDTSGTMPTTPGSSGNIRVQWAFLD